MHTAKWIAGIADCDIKTSQYHPFPQFQEGNAKKYLKYFRFKVLDRGSLLLLLASADIYTRLKNIFTTYSQTSIF